MQTEVARRTARKAGKRASKHAETATATTISLADMPAGHDNTHGLLLPRLPAAQLGVSRAATPITPTS